MTFSIVAVDRDAQEIGLAIASCCWDAGQVCMARAEVGAIASQASGNLAFLTQFFEGLAGGADPGAMLDRFKASDGEIETRQIGMIAFDGAGWSFTGAACSPWAGHRTGNDCACQGNILVGPQVADEMAEAFESTSGPLYVRLCAALSAGDEAGGDLRGKQSARLAVKKKGFGRPGSDTLIDIAIEDHAEPVREIGRILDVGMVLKEILGLLSEFSEAPMDAKPEVLARWRALLDDKRDCRYLDWWESLADRFYQIGDVERALEAYRVILSINPAMRRVFESATEQGTFPAALASVLL